MKKLLLGMFVALFTIFGSVNTASAGFLWDLFDDSRGQNYICQDDDCGVDDGIDAVRDSIQWSETQKPASQYIQDIVNYVLTFMAIVGVLYIIYAWFNILTAAGDDEKVSNSKKTITYVAIGLVVMFLAASIINFIFSIFDNAASDEPQTQSAIEQTYHI